LLHVEADGLNRGASDSMIEFVLANGYDLVTIEEMLS
jgi:hypothetical protein